MVRIDVLRMRVAESGYKMQYLARSLGLSRPSFAAKLRGKSEFSVSEVQRIADLLCMDSAEKEAVFFAKDVNCCSTRRIGGKSAKALEVSAVEAGI